MRQRLIALSVLAVALGIAAFLLFSRRGSHAPSRATLPPAPAAPGAGQTARPARAATPSAPAPAAPPAAAHPRSVDTAEKARALDPARAASRQHELLSTIHRGGGAATPASAPAAGLGTLDKESIKAAIRSVVPRLQECYEQRLKEQPHLEGKAVIKFTIVAKDGQGELDEGEVKTSTVEDLRLETCILHAVASARFPVPEGEGRVTVNYPFTFRQSKKR